MQAMPAVAMISDPEEFPLADATYLRRPDRGEKKSPDEGPKPARLQIPISYLQRIITRIRRL